MNFTFFVIAFITCMTSNLYAQRAGDGTLPVIRSLEIGFVSGNVPQLPETIYIDLNQRLKENDHIKKHIIFKELKIKQDIKLTNKSGHIHVDISSIHINNAQVRSLKENMGNGVYFNELIIDNKHSTTQEVRVLY